MKVFRNPLYGRRKRRSAQQGWTILDPNTGRPIRFVHFAKYSSHKAEMFGKIVHIFWQPFIMKQQQLTQFSRGGTWQLHNSPTSNQESWGKFKFILNLNLNDIKVLFFKPQSLNDFYSQTVENPGAEYLRWEKYRVVSFKCPPSP